MGETVELIRRNILSCGLITLLVISGIIVVGLLACADWPENHVLTRSGTITNVDLYTSGLNSNRTLIQFEGATSLILRGHHVDLVEGATYDIWYRVLWYECDSNVPSSAVATLVDWEALT